MNLTAGFFIQVAAVVGATVVAGLVFWANPQRRQNQTVTLLLLNVIAWLVFRLIAVVQDDPTRGLLWLRITTATGALIPLQLWHVIDSIVHPRDRWAAVVRRAAPYFLYFGILALIPLTEWFIPSDSSPEQRVVAPGYFVHFGGLVLGYLGLMIMGAIKNRGKSGIEHVELSVVLVTGALCPVVVILLMFAGRFTSISVPSFVSPTLVLGLSIFWAITTSTHRIFDARHLLSSLLQNVLLVLIVSAVALGLWKVLALAFPAAMGFVATVAITLWISRVMRERLEGWIRRFPRALEARSAAFAVAQNKVDGDELTEEFCSVLTGWSGSDHALILSTAKSFSTNPENDWVDTAIELTLRELEWATPERLVRERETPGRVLLAKFLESQKLGAMVLRAGPTLQVIVGVGVRPSRRPFTFPEILQLRELSSIIENALSRAQLLAKAQQAEQLATVGLLGAGVAHEIRNPLVSIKTFAQLLPQHHEDPVFRERFSRLIVEEVARIDHLTEQLMDLAAPRNYRKSRISLHEVIESTMDLAAARSTKVETDFRRDLQAEPDEVHSDTNALKQVVLNLCLNAVQAQEQNPPDRPAWVEVATRRLREGVEMSVRDNGPGIQAHERTHLFEVFHSTKSSGFGLGLSVCGEILSSLDSTITLDPYVAGEGALFRVILPCPPRS